MTTFTVFHTVLSLVALVAGMLLLAGMLRDRVSETLVTLYFVTAVLTDLTGFGLPADRLLPSHIVAIVSLLALAAAAFVRLRHRLEGGWRVVDALAITLSVYLLGFVTIIQSFLKVGALRLLAPTLKEPPFVMAQAITLLVFVVAAGLLVRATHRSELMRNPL